MLYCKYGIQTNPVTNFAITDNLNWTVERRQLSYPSADGSLKPYFDRVAIVRSDNDVCLGVVSPDYETVQNDVLLSKINPLVEEGLLEIETMGYLRDGANVFIQAKIAKEFRVLGEDYSSYITLLNGHTGLAPVSLGTSTVRVICNNTFVMANRDLSSKFKHYKGVNDKVLESQEVLEYVNNAMTIYASKVETLASKTCTEANFHKAVTKIYGKEAKDLRHIEQLNNLFYNGTGTEGKTYYDAFNAITEYGSHKSRRSREGCFNYTNFGAGVKINKTAMSVLTEFASV